MIKMTIEAKTKELTDASSKMAERLYAQGKLSKVKHKSTSAGSDQDQAEKKSENVVDAEFEEVKDDKK